METGPQHGIIGDENFGTDLAQTEIPEQDLLAERNAAKFSRTREFKILKEYLEGRMEHYRTYLPDGRPVDESQPTSEDWRVANRLIGEFRAVINAYEQAQEAVKNAGR